MDKLDTGMFRSTQILLVARQEEVRKIELVGCFNYILNIAIYVCTHAVKEANFTGIYGIYRYTESALLTYEYCDGDFCKSNTNFPNFRRT